METNEKKNHSFYFQWHILEQCNLRCNHCYQNGHRKGTLAVNDLDSIMQSMESALAQWRYSGRVSLTGGEPLIVPETVFRLVDFFNNSQHFVWVAILTNGTLLSPEIAKNLANYKKLREIQVSIDGANAEIHDSIRGTGTFERTLRGIEYARQAGLRTAVMFTLTRHNSCDAVKIIDLALELGVDALTIERATPTGPQCDVEDLIDSLLLQETYRAIAHRKSEIGASASLQIRTSRPLWCLVDSKMGGFCPVGLSCLAILHDGTVLPCRRLEIPIGNILTDGLYNIWYTSPVLWKLRDKNLLDSNCRYCKMLASCGGCRAAAYANTGDYMGKDPHCWANIQKEVASCHG